MNETATSHNFARNGKQPVITGRPLSEWPGLVRGRGCALAGCPAAPAVFLGGFGFCRAHWPAVRRWWALPSGNASLLDGNASLPDGRNAAEATGVEFLDLHHLYGRRAALEYLNGRLVELGGAAVAEGTFLKMTHAVYGSLFRLQPLALGERAGPMADGRYANVNAFTARMLDEAAARRVAGCSEPVRPSAAEREAYCTAGEAVEWLKNWWAERGVTTPFRMTARHLLYYADTGRVPVARIGQANVFLLADLARLARAVQRVSSPVGARRVSRP